jgi:hypothetical protein
MTIILAIIGFELKIAREQISPNFLLLSHI